MKPVRVLALSPVPEEGAGCRFRIAQFVPFLESHGFEVTIRPFFTQDFFRLAYHEGHYFRKALLFAVQTARRLRLLAERGRYDLIFIYREAFPIGPPLIERLLSRAGGPAVVYDFDDAVFLPNTSEANRFVSLLKYPRKVRRIINDSDQVIAGNEYLAAYARAHNRAVTVIPTCVDATKFVPRRGSADGGDRPLVVGWIGSPTTAQYLLGLAPVMQRLASAHEFVLRVGGAGREVQIAGMRVENLPWTLEREVELFNTCDIGVYPLSDDDWTRGKCGFKAIQFMACAVPVVAAAVGVNREIVEDGVNGFLASTDEEWVEKLRRLLTSSSLRQRLGCAGRKTVEDRYSVAVNAPKLVSVLEAALERSNGSGRRRPR